MQEANNKLANLYLNFFYYVQNFQNTIFIPIPAALVLTAPFGSGNSENRNFPHKIFTKTRHQHT